MRRNPKGLFVIKDVVQNEYFNKHQIYGDINKSSWYSDEDRWQKGFFRTSILAAQIFKGRGVPSWYMNPKNGNRFSKQRRSNLKVVEIEIKEKE